MRLTRAGLTIAALQRTISLLEDEIFRLSHAGVELPSAGRQHEPEVQVAFDDDDPA